MSRKRIATTIWTRLKQLLLRAYGLSIRIKVVGHGRIAVPLHQGFIVAANHLTGADSLVIQLALRTRLFFVTSARWLATRSTRFFMSNVCDSVPADTGAGFDNVAGVRKCVRTLESGGSIGIYPEGRLNREGRVDRIESGAAWLAARTGTPILPVYVRNLKLGPEPWSRPWLSEAWEGFFSVVGNLLNTEIEVVVGDPIAPMAGAAKDPDSLRCEVERLNAELRRSFDLLAGQPG
jgi:1-acyl-sn-glycerol-3-phosphate acyltransferase